MCVFSNLRTGMWSKFLRVNRIASVLEGLNVTSHCLDHCDKSIRSWFMRTYTTLTNFSTVYLVMCKVYIDVGGIK